MSSDFSSLHSSLCLGKPFILNTFNWASYDKFSHFVLEILVGWVYAYWHWVESAECVTLSTVVYERPEQLFCHLLTQRLSKSSFWCGISYRVDHSTYRPCGPNSSLRINFRECHRTFKRSQKLLTWDHSKQSTLTIMMENPSDSSNAKGDST